VRSSGGVDGSEEEVAVHEFPELMAQLLLRREASEDAALLAVAD
jgi:hypothetical protein